MLREENRKHVQMMVGIILLSALLLALLPTQLVAAKERPQPLTWHAVVGVESSDHAIQGMAFLPHELWINVGDTVVWTVKSGDIHTVTFLKPGQTLPPFNAADPLQALPQGGHIYDGKSYYNSGLMSSFPGLPVPGGTSYSLTFGVTGDFIYYCLVHPSMIGIVHVRPVGTPYPFSQEDYNKQIEHQTHFILKDGASLADQAEDSSDNHHVTVGIGDGLVGLMRFYPQQIVIDAGDTVIFPNRDPMEPHTVTFGPVPSSGDFAPYGNPRSFDGTTPLNSGFIGADPAWFGTTFTVTFVKSGIYHFRCDLHDYLGMLITIIVKP